MRPPMRPPKLVKPSVGPISNKAGFIIGDHGKNGRTGPDTEDEMSVHDVG